ncbi:MAG: CPBP family intramembrane metalloprotease [Acidobacteriia bacterium]|nr:CPBP family intramembrane metalloprotease [Terriglobia bacterium]
MTGQFGKEDCMADPGVVLPPEPTSPPPSNPAPQPKWKAILRGPNGIRAGWRVLIFLLIVIVLSAALALVLRLVGRGTHTANVSMLTPLGLSITEGTLFLLTAIAALIMGRIEHRKFGAYGLPAQSAFRQHFWVGTSAGFLAISTSLLGIFALHGFRLTGLAIHGPTIVSATVVWAATFVIVGSAEEFSFRGYLQFTLTTGMGFWPSAILLSALFGLAHASNPGETKFGLLSVVLFGLLFCLFLRRTGNLWWAVGFHAGWDWGQTFFYGVPDSGIAPYRNLFNCTFNGPGWLTGGSVGPEASIFTPIVLVIVAILFTRVYRENRYQL